MSVCIKYLNCDASLSEEYTTYISELLEHFLEDHNLSGGEVGVIIADNVSLQKLNRQYRNQDRPTDVLSFSYLEPADQFSLDEKEFAVGDIYISIEKARAQAKEADHDLMREVTCLVVHGMLHLLDYSHGEESDAKLMRKKEQEFMEIYDSKFAGGEEDD